MKSINYKNIQLWSDQMQTIWLPDFSEILDISYDKYISPSSISDSLKILYQYDYDLAGTNTKMFNIWITDSESILPPPSELYKYFGKIEKKHSEVNLAYANNGRLVTTDTIIRHFIFIEEVKTIAENRNEKLNDIL